MATSRASTACLRRLTSQNAATKAVSNSLATNTVSRRCLHTPPPLFLDFLAPTWRPQAASVQPIRPPQQNSLRRQATAARSFTTSSARYAKAIANPRKDDDGNEMTITITPRAAHRLQAIAEKDGNPDLALRVAVESGGCRGFQYLMSLVNTSDMDAQEDTLFENEEQVEKKGGADKGGYKAKVVMDEPSLELLKGSSVDYTMELIGSQFKITGIPGATSSCGCGTSFDVAA